MRMNMRCTLICKTANGAKRYKIDKVSSRCLDIACVCALPMACAVIQGLVCLAYSGARPNHCT